MGAKQAETGNPLQGRRKLTLVTDDAQDPDEQGPAAPGRAATRNGPPAAPTGEWAGAVADFLLDVRASREEKTAAFYADRMRLLQRWAVSVANAGQGVGLAEFKARHLRQYLQWRGEQIIPRTGRPPSDTTRRLDAIAARKFIAFCQAEDYIEGNPLADYQIPKQTRARTQCPREEDVARLLQGCQDRWRVKLNPHARFIHKPGRTFFERRNYAILTGLVTTGCRIGEMLALRLADFDPAAGTVHFRNTKGDEDRTVPFEPGWGEIAAAWLRVRPAASPADTLFVTEYGGAMDVNYFRRQFYKDREFAGTPAIGLHHLRHYALTQISRKGVKEAQQIAGHKSLSTTQIYIHTDGDRMRQVQAEAQPLGRIMVNVRADRQKRKKLTKGK